MLPKGEVLRHPSARRVFLAVGRSGVGLVALLLWAACGDKSGTGCDFGRSDEPDRTCSLEEELRFVAEVLSDQYLYASQVGVLSADEYRSYDSAAALLGDVRQSVSPPDRFSYIIDRARREQAAAGRYHGFGYRSAWTEDREVMVIRVYGTYPPEPPTPASEQGLRRGEIIYGINGTLFADATNEEISELFGPGEEGVTRTLMVRAQDGSTRELEMSKQEILRHTVPITDVFEVNGEPVAYVFFESFLSKSREELDAAFAVLRQSDIQTVILDLRYNSGGLVWIAEHLTNLLAGDGRSGQTMYGIAFNEAYAHCNSAKEFEAAEFGLQNTQKVVVITGPATASASEGVWNHLRAYVDVVAVGSPSVGKSTGFFPYEFCGKVLWPVNFQTVNADGEATPPDGIMPACAAEDDLTHALGDPNESRLAAALAAVQGRCPQALTVAGPRLMIEDDNDLHWR